MPPHAPNIIVVLGYEDGGRGLSDMGQVFDSSVSRGKPFQFKVNLGMVIAGWDKCVMSMKVGEKCVVTCDYKNAYGERGMPPVIPPSATLVFEVELLSIGGASSGGCTVI